MRHSIYKRWMAMSPLARTGAGACLLLAILALALRVVGASWVNVAFAVVPLGVAFLLVAAEPRLHWLTRPKPKLTLAVSGAEGGRLVSGGLPPWPLQIERIVANEVAEALDTMKGRETLPSFLTAGAAGLVSPPTEEDHQRAKQEFGTEVETYQEELREWLNEYAEMVLARWETFAVSLVVTNAVGAAHAEAVELVLELPESVNRSSPVGRVEPPPSRPTYRPPQPRSLLPSHLAGWNGPYPRIAPLGPGVDLNDIIPSGRRRAEWEESAAGRHLTAPRVDVQPGRSIEIVAPLWLRARGSGVHEVRWTAYSQTLDHPVRGAFRLEVPEEPTRRPPFGRLEGILRFPDVEIAMEDDEAAEVDGDGADADGDRAESVVRSIRDSDPPLAPPSGEAVDGGQGEALASLRGAVRRWEWEALGLDPALDGPSSARVTVGRAQPSTNAD